MAKILRPRPYILEQRYLGGPEVIKSSLNGGSALAPRVTGNGVVSVHREDSAEGGGQLTGPAVVPAGGVFGDKEKIKKYTVGYAKPTNKVTTKDYSQLIRVYDVDGYRMRVDSVCFRDSTKKEILMISCRDSREEWSLPGGGLEPNETAAEAALREVTEEAGVRGEIQRYVGTFDNDEGQTRTEVFTMIVREELHEWRDRTDINRRRKWFSVQEALRLSERKPLKHTLLAAACMPDSSGLFRESTATATISTAEIAVASSS